MHSDTHDGTLGRTPFKHQQYLGLLIRPNPASSWKNRRTFPVKLLKTFSNSLIRELFFLRLLSPHRLPFLGVDYVALPFANYDGAAHGKFVHCLFPKVRPRFSSYAHKIALTATIFPASDSLINGSSNLHSSS